jgi:hypothetical protein
LVSIAGVEVRPAALALTLALGTAGGLAAQALHLPLGLLLGSLGTVGLIAAVDWRPLGQPIHLPQPLRMVFVPVIGVAIGGAFTPDILAQAVDWGPSLLGLCLALACALALSGWVGEPVAGVFRAYAPGGLAEMSLIALSLQISVVFVTVHHVARIVLAVSFARVGVRWVRAVDGSRKTWMRKAQRFSTNYVSTCLRLLIFPAIAFRS